MNKKAGMFTLIAWIVGTIIVVLFLAGYLYMHNQLTSTLTSLTGSTPSANLSYAVESVFTPVNSAMSSLHWIGFILLVSLAIAFIMECFYVRRHPILFFIHALIWMLGIVAAIYISNYYETLLAGNILSSTFMGFKAITYLMLNLPLWVGILGFIGLVVMSVAVNRDPELKNVGL